MNSASSKVENMIDHLLSEIAPYEEELARHSVYQSVDSEKALKSFMEHHVYCVWDFMSLTKSLQRFFAPCDLPWMPPKNPSLSRFINEIVLEEESDHDMNGNPMSHFEMYRLAMGEVGADTSKIDQFLNDVERKGVVLGLKYASIPETAQTFVSQTFDFLMSEKPHVIAAAFAFGREKIVPIMFSELLDKMNISAEQAPHFHYYLQRHIDLDGGHHGPLSRQMMSVICGDDQTLWQEATQAAIDSIKGRISFWSGVEKALS